MHTLTRWSLLLSLATIALSAGCGLSERDACIADTNTKIRTVTENSELLAVSIYNLNDQSEGPDDYAALLDAYRTYRDSVDSLNVLVHQLGEFAPELNVHLRDSFDPNSENAMTLCDEATGVLAAGESTNSERQEALTSLCLCIENFASAVTEVARSYTRTAE